MVHCESGKLPLIIKGFDNSTVIAGATGRGRETLVKHRGQIIAGDIILQTSPAALIGSTVTLSVGGRLVISELLVPYFYWDARHGGARAPFGLDSGGGQTVDWQIVNDAFAQGIDSMLHFYHENPYNNARWRSRLYKKFTGLRMMQFKQSTLATIKGSTLTGVLPTNQGDIIGVAPFNDGASSNTQVQARFNLSIDGVTVFENVNGILGFYQSTIIPKVYPISIPRGSTFEWIFDNNGGSTVTNGVIFYFDDSAV
jgi:hypothetical protein